MKIAITASNNQGLDSKVDLRFGRAPYFAIVDTETMEAEFVENDATNAASGAGVIAAQLLVDHDVSGIIAGNFGPKAYTGLQAADLKIYILKEGSIKEAVDALNNGLLEELSAPTNNGHVGLK